MAVTDGDRDRPGCASRRADASFLDTLRAQREQIRVLQTQLTAFDKQVIALEQGLVPFLTWGQQWVRMQESVLGQMRDLGR